MKMLLNSWDKIKKKKIAAATVSPLISEFTTIVLGVSTFGIDSSLTTSLRGSDQSTCRMNL